MAPTPDLPAKTLSHRDWISLPRGLMQPKPVMTTRLRMLISLRQIARWLHGINNTILADWRRYNFIKDLDIHGQIYFLEVAWFCKMLDALTGLC
jgi:hypothetical protein